MMNVSQYYRFHTGLFLTLLFLCVPLISSAQVGQILSVTPPLFQLSINPGDIWQSSVKVVNGNPYEMTVYAEVVNFAPVGEHGQGKFTPLLNDTEREATLAEWIEINEGPHVISPESSKDITFFVELPDDAPPGGHFAAILIGTRPPEDSKDKLVVQTAQTVTSLFFVRIEGDVVESGNIREFSISDNFVPTPDAEFLLRFENEGNVHLQPRGNIIITNMWGKERGVIPVNYQTHFGNVLPESIREYNFSWEGERALTEIGRYKAVATLAYGENGIQNADAVTYFWVIPVKATLLTLLMIGLFIAFVTWAIKLYVRRMLMLAGVPVEKREEMLETPPPSRDLTLKTYSAPLRDGARDLRDRLRGVDRVMDVLATLFEFVKNYKIFFGSSLVITIGFIGIVFYIGDAATEQRNYEVVIQQPDGETRVNSEEIIKDRLDEDEEAPTSREQEFDLNLVNATDEAGFAAEIAVILEEYGYIISSLEVSKDDVREKTVIVYDTVLLEDAKALSVTLGDALLSARSGDIEEGALPSITIFLGKDLEE